MRKKDKAVTEEFRGPVSDDKGIWLEDLIKLFDLVPELICIASVDGYFKKLNPAWEKVLGFSVDELMSKPFVEFIHPDDIKPTFLEVEKQLKGKQTLNFTNRYRCKNGSYKTLNWVATPSPDQNLLYAAARDITEGIDKEKELIASENKYRTFFENSMDAILLTLPDGRILSANKAACKLFDYNCNEIIGLGRSGLVDSTDPRLSVLLNERDIRGKTRGELRLIKKGGIIFETDISSATIIDKDGDTRNIIIVRDITERKKAEEAFHKSQELLHTVLNSAPITIFATDEHGVFTLSEGKQLKAVNLKPGENVGLSAINLFGSLPFEEFSGKITTGADLVLRVLKGEPIVAYNELQGVIFENHMVPIRSNEGKITGMLGVATDITERKKAEEALKQSESRYKSLFDNSGSNIIIIDKDGIYQMVNKSAAENFGKKAEEIIGKSIFDFLPIEEAQKYLEFNRQLIEKGGTREYEDAFRMSTGIKSFLIVDQCLQNAEGKNIALQSSSIDVTERKIVEQQLKEAKEKYELLYTTMDEGVALNEAVVNENGEIIDYIILDVNPAFELQSPYTKKEALGNRATELYKMSEDYIRKWWNEHSLLEQAAYTEMYHEPSQRWFEITTTLLEGKLFYTIFRDITMRKMSEKALRNSELKYRNLFESSLIAISATDFDGQLIQANQAYALMYGFDSAEQMIKESKDIKLRYAYPEERTEILKILIEKGKIGPKEVEVVKRDGTKIYVLVTAHAIKDSNGKILYTQAEHIDITEQKKLQEELIQSRKVMLELSLHIEREREKERAKIALDLHDELGQVLTALIMDAAWLKRKLADKPSELTDKITSMSVLLTKTLNDIQKIAGGLRPSILDDLGIAAAIKWQIQKIAESTDLRFILSIAPEEFTLAPDLSTLIFRVIQEALTNVVRHSSATEVSVKVLKKRDKLSVNLKDNGIGISTDKIKSPVSFGLIGIRERVKTQGGSFIIKGKQGAGTEIHIEIPLSKEQKSK